MVINKKTNIVDCEKNTIKRFRYYEKLIFEMEAYAPQLKNFVFCFSFKYNKQANAKTNVRSECYNIKHELNNQISRCYSGQNTDF